MLGVQVPLDQDIFCLLFFDTSSRTSVQVENECCFPLRSDISNAYSAPSHYLNQCCKSVLLLIWIMEIGIVMYCQHCNCRRPGTIYWFSFLKYSWFFVIKQVKYEQGYAKTMVQWQYPGMTTTFPKYLTLVTLHLFKENKHIFILYHLKDQWFIHRDPCYNWDGSGSWNTSSWTIIPCSQYHGGWWLGDARSQGISSHDIDLFIPEYSSLSTRMVTFFLKFLISNMYANA